MQCSMTEQKVEMEENKEEKKSKTRTKMEETNDQREKVSKLLFSELGRRAVRAAIKRLKFGISDEMKFGGQTNEGFPLQTGIHGGIF